MRVLGEVVTVTLWTGVGQAGLRLAEVSIETLGGQTVAVGLDDAVPFTEGAALLAEAVGVGGHGGALLGGGLGAVHHGHQRHLPVGRTAHVQEVVVVTVAGPGFPQLCGAESG